MASSAWPALHSGGALQCYIPEQAAKQYKQAALREEAMGQAVLGT